MTPLQIALLFKFERFKRFCLYSDSYITSTAWKKSKTRCNTWITFQHHLHECAFQYVCGKVLQRCACSYGVCLQCAWWHWKYRVLVCVGCELC
jgi:hypothetical protein